MSVEVQYTGQLGNQMFQYAFGRILAEHFGYALSCATHGLGNVDDLRAKTFFGKTLDLGDSATLDGLAAFFKNAPQEIAGKQIDAPVESFVFGQPIWDETRPWNGQKIDLQRILDDKRERRIVLRGFFQRYEYFAKHKAKLKEWFALDPLDDEHGVTKNDLFLHVRRGPDFAAVGWVLSLAEYTKLLSEIPHERVFVSGTGIDDAVKEQLKPFSPIYYRKKPIDDFRFMMKFNKIIQSNSTFSWWAAFLSDAQEIYSPRPDRGYLSKAMAAVDLDPGEPRYRYFDTMVTDFVPFEPQRGVTKRVEGSTLIVDAPDKGTTKIPIPPDGARFYEWFAKREDRFGLRDLIEGRLLPRELIMPVLEGLVASGALAASESFSDSK